MVLYAFTMAFCLSIDGTGSSTLHISSQSITSRTLPCDLKRAYRSNSGRLNQSIRYSGKSSVSSITSKTVYTLLTKPSSYSERRAIPILSPRRDVSGMYVNCPFFTTLYFVKSVPTVFAMEGMNFFCTETPRRLSSRPSVFLTST
ncbi:hypothetical protein SDC9_97084 [bioreactor metagenome]|uniref:Uncharacterized protein n=1 Tax=bioreactor metagenome TaxID=1076179 RepID=A0A645AAW0_9ZZZZ